MYAGRPETRWHEEISLPATELPHLIVAFKKAVEPLATHSLQGSGVQPVVLRIGTIWGPLGDPESPFFPIPSYINAVLRGEQPRPLHADDGGDRCYAPDAGRAIALLTTAQTLPAGSLTMVSDPTGAVFCAREREARGGAELVNEASAWSMSSLMTPDPDGAAAFYGRLFGWQAEPFGPPEANVSLFRLPGYVGGTETQPVPRDVVAVMMPLDPEQDPHWHLDFWVSDADGAVAKARALGGDVVVEPYDAPPAFKQAVLADPQGAAFSISRLMTG